MLARVYLETTIVSYLTARTNRDLVRMAHQEITNEWWNRRTDFELYISQVVLDEAAAGDVEAAARRLDVLQNMPLVALTQEASLLAQQLVREAALPEKAAIDALHIALATVHGMEYLLTWNCTHIANATMRGKIELICRTCGYEPPAICTPLELLER